ncbi:hypothetical protein ARMGADRAFT_1075352 [Armillaria gallica]|uniref:Uncharacterized protein n=1 Tax=Armillaria gallica TaxID=47427 RepID=A0A2H3DWS4_ARMGA|nr:hypothetical protein ARMGADRAFT_1075352 [Armillaria gallica]
MSAEMVSAATHLVRERATLAEQAVRNREASWSDDPGDRTARGRVCGGGYGVIMGIARTDTGDGKLTVEERTEIGSSSSFLGFMGDGIPPRAAASHSRRNSSGSSLIPPLSNAPMESAANDQSKGIAPMLNQPSRALFNSSTTCNNNALPYHQWCRGSARTPRFIVDGSSDTRDGDVQVPDDIPTAIGAGTASCCLIFTVLWKQRLFRHSAVDLGHDQSRFCTVHLTSKMLKL